MAPRRRSSSVRVNSPCPISDNTIPGTRKERGLEAWNSRDKYSPEDYVSYDIPWLRFLTDIPCMKYIPISPAFQGRGRQLIPDPRDPWDLRDWDLVLGVIFKIWDFGYISKSGVWDWNLFLESGIGIWSWDLRLVLKILDLGLGFGICFEYLGLGFEIHLHKMRDLGSRDPRLPTPVSSRRAKMAKNDLPLFTEGWNRRGNRNELISAAKFTYTV